MSVWICQCDCGEITYATSTVLRNKTKTRCASCSKAIADIVPPDLDIQGQRFGHFTVLHHIERNREYTHWLCLCDCGTSIVITRRSLQTGHRKSCGKCHLIRKHGKTDGSRVGVSLYAHYMSYYRGAISRNLPFELTKEYFSELVQSNCFYCGIEPSKNEVRFLHNGIDRIDSTQGYILGNVRPCCKQCNYAKNTLTEQQFLDWLRRITINLKLGEVVL